MMTVTGVGRLTRDPETKAVNDTCVCEFSLAVNEYRKVGDERKKFAHFFDFVIWDKAAEVIATYCKKGDLLEVRATPRQDRWEDGEGNNRSRIIFRVDEFSLLPRGSSNNKEKTEDTEEKVAPF